MSTAAAFDVHREVRGLLDARGCCTPAECAAFASAVLGREVGPGRNAIRPDEVPLLMTVLREGRDEPHEETP